MGPVRRFTHDTFASLAIWNYRLYFFGQAVSISGTWMQTVALGWLVLQVTGSGTQLGSVIALQFLPILVLGAWGGAIVDRLEKRHIIYLTQIAFFFLALGISALVYFDIVQIWMLYIYALTIGTVRVFDEPARQIFISEIVGREHIKNAVSLNSTLNNLARIIGPTFAGIIITAFNIAFCFLANAFSYLFVMVALWFMDARNLAPVVPSHKKSGQVLEGLRYVRGTPLVRDTLLMMAIIGAFTFEFSVFLPLIAREVFHGDASSYAALMSAMGVGAVIGGLFAAGRKRVAPHHIVVAAVFFGGSMIAVSLMPTLFLAIAGMVVVGFFSINTTTLGNTIVQLESDPTMRGRVMALWSIAMLGTTFIGAPVAGAIGEYAGGRWALAVGGISAIVAAAFFAYTLLRKDKEQAIPEAVAVEAELRD